MLTTAVGDRYVLEALRAKDLNLGGEQSGHVVFTDSATTGDGLLTALHVMARMAATGSSLADLAGVVQRLPQTLINVKVHDRAAVAASLDGCRRRRRRRAASWATTGGSCCARPAPKQLVRVMVEAATQEHADEIAQRVAAVVAAA